MRHNFLVRWLLASLAVFFTVLPGLNEAKEAAESGNLPSGGGTGLIAPPDVFARVALVRAELELIRFEMGKPENEQAEIAVKSAAPREVFFQALTLFHKADRLSFEQTRRRAAAPDTPEGKIRPAQVYAVVDAALERIQLVKAHLGIVEKPKATPRDPTKTPTDVFRAIVQANRQLNLLLEQRFAPSDVFQQVTLAVGFTSRLLARVPEATRIPPAPPFERGKRPADVYHRLTECFERTRLIAERSGLKILKLETTTEGLDAVTPSDVYDIASLVVSELAYLHSQLEDAQPPNKVYYPGRKLPSHVFQRAGILEKQLTELEQWVEKEPPPDSLKKKIDERSPSPTQ